MARINLEVLLLNVSPPPFCCPSFASFFASIFNNWGLSKLGAGAGAGAGGLGPKFSKWRNMRFWSELGVRVDGILFVSAWRFIWRGRQNLMAQISPNLIFPPNPKFTPTLYYNIVAARGGRSGGGEGIRNCPALFSSSRRDDEMLR